MGVGGAKTKYVDNVAAIRLLKQLQANGAALATPEEQKILVRYVGWGGLPQVFDAQNEQWAAEYREMQGLLSPELSEASIWGFPASALVLENRSVFWNLRRASATSLASVPNTSMQNFLQ